jgi:hypothetical protein
MTKAQLAPKGEPFVMLTRSILRSDAWRSLGIGSRRLIDFLMLEHMGKGGKENGKLKAPRQQLHEFGIGAHQVTAAIRKAEEVGLVDCIRGGLRVATAYRLTWLPSHDGAPPTNRWASYRCLGSEQPRKNRNLTVNQQSGLTVNQQSDGQNLTVNQQSDRTKTLTVNQQYLSRRSYQGGSDYSEVEVGGASASAAPHAATPDLRVLR